MGRERQKRKNRSGLSRVRQRTKSKKTVLNNPIIAANWDKSQTLSQNYKRLGLTTKLNKQSGGVEKKIADIQSTQQDGTTAAVKPDSLKITSAHGSQSFNLGEAKVERDAQTGRIIRIVADDTVKIRANPLQDSLNDLDSDSDEDATKAALADQHGTTEAALMPTNASGISTNVIQQLEERASLPAAKFKRRQTDNEQAFIESLVRKYGSEYGKMARDMKLNYMQRSEGDLKRRIKIWKDNGGIVS